MAKYTYRCDKCDRVVMEMRPVKERDYEELCGEPSSTDSSGICTGTLRRQIATTIAEPSIMETVDPYRNVKHRKDQDRRIRERSKAHFKKTEMEELIEKYGVENAKKFGWIKDGKKNKDK